MTGLSNSVPVGLPFALAELIDDDDGILMSDRLLPVPANFTFVWKGIHFSGHLDNANPAGASPTRQNKDLYLTLGAEMGPIPYTAEDGAGRRAALGFASRRVLSAGGTHQINEKQCLEFEAMTKLKGPVSGRDIMTAVVVVLLQMTRYFELARETIPARVETGNALFTAERLHRLH